MDIDLNKILGTEDMTLLHMASTDAQEARIEIYEILLNGGLDINAVTEESASVMSYLL